MAFQTSSVGFGIYSWWWALGIIHIIIYGSSCMPVALWKFTLHEYNLIFSKNPRMVLFRFLKHFLWVAPSYPILCSMDSDYLSFPGVKFMYSQFSKTVMFCLGSLVMCKSRNFLQKESWKNCSSHILVFVLLMIIVLHCLFFNNWKQLFHTFCLGLYLFTVEEQSITR